MSAPDPQSVDELFGDLLHTEDDVLAAARASTTSEGLPPIEVSPQHGRLLALLATMSGARRVLEIGTLAGYSTINLARGVGDDGRVVTLEFDPHHADVATANLTRAGVADRVEVLVGAALDTLPTLGDRGPFDLVFIDADKENNVAYVEWAIRLGRPGTVIVVDNVTRMGRVLAPASDDLQAGLDPVCWTRSIPGMSWGKRDDPTRWQERITPMSSSVTRSRCTGTPRVRRSR